MGLMNLAENHPIIASGLGIGAIFGAIATVALWTDSSREQLAQYFTDQAARVTCYSGGKMIYDGFSTGKVRSEQDSDGYNFVSVHTNRLREVSGDCDIDYGAIQPKDFTPVFRVK